MDNMTFEQRMDAISVILLRTSKIQERTAISMRAANQVTTSTFSIKELELMVGAVLYRLVAFKQAVPPADPADIADHQALYERLNGMSEV